MDELVCSFCGKPKDGVDKLIAGPGVYICDEDVARATSGTRTAASDAKCSFCGKSGPEVAWMFGDEVTICNECVTLCMEIIREELTPVQDDPLARFIAEVETRPRLTEAEEAELLGRIGRARAATARLSSGILAEEERAQLAAAVADGRNARDRLITGNLWLVLREARRPSRSGDNLLDLVQEGNLALMRAADEVDPSKGYLHFHTLATALIRDAMARIPPKIVQGLSKEEIEAGLRAFPLGDQEVLRYRFGLAGDPPASTGQTAERFVLTREHVRALESRFLRTALSAPPRALDEPGPRCPSCKESLANARARELDVPGDQGAPPVRVLFVYCGACGAMFDSEILPND